MNFPQNLKYTNEHEWIRVDGDIAYVGITDYAQEQLGDIVFVDIPTVGETLEAGETFGTIEVVKTISDLFLPIAGEVLSGFAVGLICALLVLHPVSNILFRVFLF